MCSQGFSFFKCCNSCRDGHHDRSRQYPSRAMYPSTQLVASIAEGGRSKRHESQTKPRRLHYCQSSARVRTVRRRPASLAPELDVNQSSSTARSSHPPPTGASERAIRNEGKSTPHHKSPQATVTASGSSSQTSHHNPKQQDTSNHRNRTRCVPAA